MFASNFKSSANRRFGGNSDRYTTSKKTTVDYNPTYATQLFDSFSHSCPSISNWSQNALSSSRSIINVLETMKEDCQTAAKNIMAQTNTLQQAIESYESRYTERDILGLLNQQKEILVLINNLEQNSSNELSELEALYRSNQLEISLNKASIDYDEEQARDYFLSTSIVQSTQAIFEQVAQNNACFMHNSGFLSGIASLGSSVGAALSTGGLSLGFAAGAHFLNSAFEFLKNKSFDRDIQKLGQSQYSSAFRCVFESLSNQYCDATETYDLIEMKIEGAEYVADDFSVGVELYTRELPVFIEWLNSVSSSTDPQDTYRASKMADFKYRENELDVWKLRSIGRLNNEVSKIARNPKISIDEKFRKLRNVLNNIAKSSRNGPNPIKDLYSEKELVWYLVGLNPSSPDLPVDSNNNIKRYTDSSAAELKALGVYPADEATVTKRIAQVIGEAKFQLDLDRPESILEDPESIFDLVETEKKSGFSRGVKPNEALKRIVTYLDKHIIRNQTGIYSNNQERIYAETRDILDEIKNQVEDYNGNVEQRLKVISQSANLTNGTTLINGRLKRFFRNILTNILLDKDPSTRLPEEVKLLTVDDMLSELDKLGRNNPGDILLDLSNTIDITKQTIQSFAEIFASPISATLNATAGNTLQSVYTRDLLPQYCSILLSVPNWSSKELKKIDLSQCFGLNLKSRQAGNPGTEAFTPELYHSNNYKKRACLNRNHRRKENLFHLYREQSNKRGSIINDYLFNTESSAY